jgi:hypothetical protein
MDDIDHHGRKFWVQHIEGQDWKVVCFQADPQDGSASKRIHYIDGCGSESEARRKWMEITRKEKDPEAPQGE